MSETAAPSRTTASLVLGLGLGQLIAWAILFYSIAVLGGPMRRELDLSETQLFFAFALCMALSGVLAPWAGRLLDRRGGRFVLALSSLVGALGFATLSYAPSFALLMVGWVLNGLAMALGLYDTCFAALGQAKPGAYRGAVTGITLLAGFASTVSFPASHYLSEALGWRATCQVYAVCLLACGPLYLVVLPTLHNPGARARSAPRVAEAASPATRSRARVLSLAFAGIALISAALSAHLVRTLENLEFTADQAVWLGASVGVMQVLGRTLELFAGRRWSANALGRLTFAGMAFSLLLLLGTTVLPALAFAFVLFYGVCNGLLTIAKALVPIELFGLRNVGAVLGSFSAPSLVARAVAPLAFAALVSGFGTRWALGCTLLVSIMALLLFLAAGRTRAPQHARLDLS